MQPRNDATTLGTSVLRRVSQVTGDLVRRSAAEHVRIHGPLPRSEIAHAADEVRDAAVDLLVAGYPMFADAARAFADRLDETAELAHVLERFHAWNGVAA